MANEIRIQFQPDVTDLYACVFRDNSGTYEVYDAVGNGWEEFDDANIDTKYDIALTEFGDESMLYIANFPTAITDPGLYDIMVYKGDKSEGTAQAGIKGWTINWNGSGEVGSTPPLVISAGYVGDYQIGDTVYFDFSTTDTLADDPPTVRVYKNDASDPIGTPQATIDVDDAEANVHTMAIILSEANYDRDADYTVVLSGATIGGESVSAVIGSFSIQNRFQKHTQRYLAE